MAGNKKKVWLGCCGGALIGVPVVCGVCGYFAMQSLGGGDAKKLPALRRQAQALGIPLEPTDIVPNPPIPDSQNAAFLYKQAFKLYAAMLKTDSKRLGQIRRLGLPDQKPQEAADARAAIKTCGPLIALTTKAASMDRCYFPHEYSNGFAETFPEFAQIKDCQYLMTGVARVHAESGDVSGAFKSLVVAAAIARQVGRSPLLIGTLVEVAMGKVALRATEDILAELPRDPAAISGARRVLDTLGPPPSIRQALVTEIPLNLIGLRSIRSWSQLRGVDSGEPGGNQPGPIDGFLISNPTFRQAVEAKYLETIIKMVKGFPQDAEDWRGFRDDLTQIERDVQADRSLPNRVAQLVLPMFEGFPVTVGTLHADLNLVATSVKLLAMRAAGKPVPSSLPDFGPISIDPMDGKPLRYRRVANGFKLWALGRDLVDHGGNPQPRRGMASDGYDDVLEFK